MESLLFTVGIAMVAVIVHWVIVNERKKLDGTTGLLAVRDNVAEAARKAAKKGRQRIGQRPTNPEDAAKLGRQPSETMGRPGASDERDRTVRP
jgi:hypothetical protein